MKTEESTKATEYIIAERSIKGIVFDMDGVVFDTEPLHRIAWIDSLAELGLKMSDDELIEWTGIPCQTLAEELERRNPGLHSPEKYHRQKEAHFYRLIGSRPSLFKGLEECFEELFQHFPIALATSNRRENVKLLLEKWGVGRYFKGSVSYEDVINHKPDPEAYIKAAAILDIPAENCIALDDSLSGCKSAKAAGMLTFGIAGSFPGSELAMADRVFSSTPECCKWIIENISLQQ